MKYILNKSQVRTTNNFGINDIKVDLDIKETNFNSYKFSNTKDIIIEESIKNNYNSRIGLPSNKYLNINITPQRDIDKIIINYDFSNDNNYLASTININLEYNMNVIVCYRSNNKSINNSKISIKTKKNNKSNISIINLASDDSMSFISIDNEVLDDSNIVTNYFDLSGSLRISNYYSNICGKNGESNFNTIYIGDNDDRLDMNYYTVNNNEKTKGNMVFEGLLLDNSFKSLKGTIDFMNNSKESVGKENENCLLLSNTCKSKSLPIILCNEEDVEGSHGMSSGKIDDNKLFYLMSRGIEEKDAKKLIIMSRFDPILNNILDDNIKEEVIEVLNKKIKE